MRSSFDTRRFEDVDPLGCRPLTVAAAVIGAGVIGAVGSSVASGNAADASEAATAAQSASAANSAQLGQEQLDFDKQQYNDGKPLRDEAAQTAIDIGKTQVATQQKQSDIADEQQAYRVGTFEPLEKQIVSTAQGYDTPERRAEAAAAATADQESAYGTAQMGLQQSLGRAGITPGSNRALALMSDQSYAKAGSVAGATTNAVRNVETLGAAKMADAANLGRNLASNQVATVNSSINAGNSAVNANTSAVADQSAGIPAMNAGYSGAIGASNSAGQLYGQVANAYGQTAGADAAAWGSLGKAAGTYAGNGGFSGLSNYFTPDASSAYGQNGSDVGFYVSDRTVKKNTGKRVSTKRALAQIDATPVEDGWSYDPKKGGPDDGGAPHTGPMAQSVRATMGDRVAPGGKKIDAASMNGQLLAGMQEISKRVKKLEGRS